MFEITARYRAARGRRPAAFPGRILGIAADTGGLCRQRRHGDRYHHTDLSTPTVSPAIFRECGSRCSEGLAGEIRADCLGLGDRGTGGRLTVDLRRCALRQAAGVAVNGKFFLIEAIAAPEAFGQAYLYRLQLREALPQDI